VCSLAYSATGSLSQSEDLAQETFIAAWKGLRTLRDPERLRSWLCGIARNIIAGAVRSRKQEPANAAEPIEAVVDLPSPDSLPVDRAISHEEESILSVLAVTFLVTRRIFFRKPEQTIGIMCAIEIAYFLLLMIVMCFRWEKWTGESPWQLHSYALIPIVVGFLLFLFFPIVWLVKRSKK
jgi:hypothetical protein